jgi:hypothetical protein
MLTGNYLFGLLFVMVATTLATTVWLVKHPYMLLALHVVPVAWFTLGPAGAAGAVLFLSGLARMWR